MKATINRKELLNTLKLHKPIANTKKTMPILMNVKLEVLQGQGIARITSTDLELELQSNLKALDQIPGAVCLDANTLLDFTKNSSEDFITIESLESNWVLLKDSQGSFKAMGLSADEFPKFQENTFEPILNISAYELLGGISNVEDSMSNDEMRYNLNGIYFDITDNNLRLVATDGHRLSMQDQPVITKGIPGFIFPSCGITLLDKLLKSEGIVSLSKCDNVCKIEFDTHSLKVRLIVGEYPDYKQVLPKELSSNTLTLSSKEVIPVLKRLAKIADKAGCIKITVNGKVELFCSNPGKGEIRAEINGIYQKGFEIVIGLNVNYLADMLKNRDSIDLIFADNMSPISIRDNGNKEFFGLMMPMRTE